MHNKISNRNNQKRKKIDQNITQQKDLLVKSTQQLYKLRED